MGAKGKKSWQFSQAETSEWELLDWCVTVYLLYRLFLSECSSGGQWPTTLPVCACAFWLGKEGGGEHDGGSRPDTVDRAFLWICNLKNRAGARILLPPKRKRKQKKKKQKGKRDEWAASISSVLTEFGILGISATQYANVFIKVQAPVCSELVQCALQLS